MQVNGQYQQAGQYSQLKYNANRSNRGYENNTSYTGEEALFGHYTMHNVGVQHQSTQRQNNFMDIKNQLPASSYKDYYQNFAQNASNQSKTPAVSLNQHEAYYQSQVFLQHNLKQSLKSMTGNVSVTMTNPTTSLTMHQIGNTQQSAVQSPVYNRTSQQAAFTPNTSPYINAFSNIPNTQNAQIHTRTSHTLVSTSCVNKILSNNQNVQNNYFASQTNNSSAVPSGNGCALLPNLSSNANSQNNSLTVHVQPQHPPHYESHKNIQQTSVGVNGNMKIAQPVIQETNDRGMNTSAALLPSPTYVHSAQSNVKNMWAAPPQITMPTKDHSVKFKNSQFFHKMNDVSNNTGLQVPLNQESELSSCKAFTLSSAEARDSLLQVSPGHGTRAVAVVLPLSQDSSPNKHPSSLSLSSSNPASDSSFFSTKQLDKAPVQTPDTVCSKQRLMQSTSSSNNISTDKGNAQAPSPSQDQNQSSMNTGVKVSALPLTFTQLVKGISNANISGWSKKKSGKSKTSTGQTSVEEELSPVPTTEWTLKMLFDKILEFEKKKKDHTSKNIHNKNSCVTHIVQQFWKGDSKTLFDMIRSGNIHKEMLRVREFCSKIDKDMVILSQNQSIYPSKYHVLLHDEIYVEQNSYTSSWLNINQLDDIDKEFGFPLSLRYCTDGRKSVESEPKIKLQDNRQIEIEPAIPKPKEPINKEDPSNTISSTPYVNSLSNNAERNSTLDHLDKDAKTMDEATCVSNVQSSDSSYSFKIEVLQPEEAKRIFQQIESDSPQITDTAVTEETPSNDQENVETQTYHVTTIEKVCCIEKWKEKVFGSSSEGKCKCEEQSQNEDKLIPENKNCLPMGTIDLIEDNDISEFPQEFESIQEDKSPNKSIFIVSSETVNESLVSEIHHPPHAHHRDEREQDWSMSTESKDDTGTYKNVLQYSNDNESEMTMTDKLFEPVQDCRQEPEESYAVNLVGAGDDIERNNKRLASVNPTPLLHPFKKPKLSSPLKTQTILDSFSRCKNGGHIKTVELALFGSNNIKCASGNIHESNVQSSLHRAHSLSEKTEEAPRRIFVKFKPFIKSNKQEAESPGKNAVKTRIHEKWRNSVLLATIRLKRKNKKFVIVGGNHRANIHLNPAKHNKRVASKRKEIKDFNGQIHKKKMAHSDGKAVNMLEKPVDAEVSTLQENLLKFKVLPSTFSFKEESNNTDLKTDSKGDERIVSVQGEENLLPIKGLWSDRFTSKSSPQSPSSVPKSTGLFQEFQRRYKKRKALPDE